MVKTLISFAENLFKLKLNSTFISQENDINWRWEKREREREREWEGEEVNTIYWYNLKHDVALKIHQFLYFVHFLKIENSLGLFQSLKSESLRDYRYQNSNSPLHVRWIKSIFWVENHILGKLIQLYLSWYVLSNNWFPIIVYPGNAEKKSMPLHIESHQLQLLFIIENSWNVLRRYLNNLKC